MTNRKKLPGEDGRRTPPRSSGGDVAHAAARAGLGSVPIIGAAAAELFNLVIAPPLERRRDQWRNDLADDLKRLEEQGRLNMAELGKNDAFIDIVLVATQAALRTSNEEKRQALRNAVLNAALPSPPDETRRQMFLALVDEFTVWHLRILALVDNPPSWFAAHERPVPEFFMGVSLAGLVEAAFADLRGQRDIYDQVWRSLHQAGLVNTPSLQGMMSGGSAVMAQRTTDHGKTFLQFVSAP